MSEATTYKTALNKALHDAMSAHEKSLVLGQDVGRFSILGVTSGLFAAFGPERVRDCPIAESAMVNIGVGAALTGWKTMIEVAYADIIAVAFSSIVHSAAKMPFASNGSVNAPLVLRAPIGRWSRHGPMGTDITASWFYNVPDMRIAMPSDPTEAYWSLMDAYDQDVPTLFLEDKGLYALQGPVGPAPVPPTHVERQGDELTIVAAGRTMQLAREASEALGGDPSVELISLGIVKPLDMAPIVASVRKTGRLLVVQDEPEFGGYAPIVQAQLLNALPPAELPLMAKVTREDTFLPYAREEHHLPTADEIATAARSLASTAKGN